MNSRKRYAPWTNYDWTMLIIGAVLVVGSLYALYLVLF